jgi:hypothetical protein
MNTTAWLAIGAAGLVALLWTGVRPTLPDEPPAVPVQPAERAAESPRSTQPPPPVPGAAEELAPVTIVVRSGVRGRLATTQIVTRTRDRVHLVVEDERKEWLFVRNSVWPDRLSGYLTDHGAKQIVEYDDTALLNHQGLRGWADVVTMRFDPRLLGALRATGNVDRRFGTDFSQFVSPTSDGPGVVEVWWSHTLVLPLRLVVREGSAVLSAEILDIGPVTDDAALDMPARRFPDYAALDVADASDHRD